jgi:signal-transduction protein with cAMP-binding, CBS, and nucleotidyltransferase domain
MSEFESQLFLPGKVLLERGEQCEYLYFIAKGSVLVVNHTDGDAVARLPRFSFFGDYQIFLDSRSNVSYQACVDEDVVCYIVHKDKFLHLLELHDKHTGFFMKRAITTRRMFKRLVIESHKFKVRFTFLNLV